MKNYYNLNNALRVNASNRVLSGRVGSILSARPGGSSRQTYSPSPPEYTQFRLSPPRPLGNNFKGSRKVSIGY